MKANLIIRASAGTGKTFSLATRFIRLMAFENADPRRIVALTFSRAAAQEIYVKLLERLWRAARSDEGAQAERGLLLQGLSPEDRAAVERRGVDLSRTAFVRLLQRVVDAQESGSIATLDSFILRIVRSFPLEMGFQHAVDVLDDYGEKTAIARTRDALLSDNTDNAKLAEDFRTAQRGEFVRTCAEAFGRILSGWRGFLADHPDAGEWTAESMCAALGLEADPQPPDLSSVPVSGKRGDPRDGAVAHILGYGRDGARPSLMCAPDGRDALRRVRTFDPNKEIFPKTKAGDLMRFLVENPAATAFAYTTEKGQEKSFDCGEAGAAAIRAGVAYMMAVSLKAKLEVVAAKLKLCALVERDYDVATRRQGLLTFADFTHCQAVKEDSEAGLRLENLQFRFDAKFDHWALDEFQDTSVLQWTCLKRLVREAASDPERTVMAVGDLKQSIYAWRGGDDAPFKEILERWPEFSGECGESVKNDVTYRYEKHTADFVNRVFGPENLKDNPRLAGAGETAVARWLADDCWMTHRPDMKNGQPKADDYVEVVSVRQEVTADADGPAEGADEEDGGSAALKVLLPKIGQLVQDLWRRHEAAADGKGSTETIGILVRNNRDGAALAEYLRGLPDGGVPVVWEGMDGVLDAPVVRGVIELLKLANHPQDRFAWETVNRLFPIRERVFPDLAYPGTVSQELSRQLCHLGLARTLREIVRRLTVPEAGLDARSRLRLEALVRAGAQYEARTDAAGDLDEFPKFLTHAAARDVASSASVVRIMTIHRSKGLTLDHVIVPVLEAGKRDSIVRPGRHAVLTGAGWALEAPSESLVRMNPQLAAAWTAAASANLSEQLRTYYVALTRARKSTYVFVVEDDHAGVVQFRDLLLSALPAQPEERPYGRVLFADGRVPSFGRRADAVCAERPAWTHADGSAATEHRSPSAGAAAHGGGGAVAGLFGATYGQAAAKGTDRHAAYAQIEWLDPSASDGLLAADWREAFVRPSSDATVWRERSYELYADGCWETGQFDRVVFSGDGADRTAAIYDFKTNAKAADESETAFADRMRGQYAFQMESYRKALSRLTGLPLTHISASLLLEATGRVVRC